MCGPYLPELLALCHGGHDVGGVEDGMGAVGKRYIVTYLINMFAVVGVGDYNFRVWDLLSRCDGSSCEVEESMRG